MSNENYKMLIMFDTKANSNKFYEMTLDNVGTTHVKFGRVGAGAQTTSYPGGAAGSLTAYWQGVMP